MSGEEWRCGQAVARWLEGRPSVPRWEEAESVFRDDVLAGRPIGRVLDLGTGDGYMLATLLDAHPSAEGVGLDISRSLLEAAGRRFESDERVHLVEHDLAEPLPSDLGRFQLVVSALAIHHLPDARKRSLYAEAFELLEPGGVFCNIDVVASPTPELHRRAQAAFGFGPEDEHPSDQPAPLQVQLDWLREIGFTHVDCYWKWLELGILAGERPLA
jgi:tRNA (cmo5U34)-methyltransferase